MGGGGPLGPSAGAEKTATGAKAAMKRVNRVEKCMLAAIDCGWVGVVEVLYKKSVCSC